MNVEAERTSLLRYSLGYLWAKGIPGIINFTAIAVYTRLVSPEDFGFFALVIASVLLANAVFFQWLRLSLLRFLTASSNQDSSLAAALYGFAATVLLTGAIGTLPLLLADSPHTKAAWLLGIGLLWVHAWFELNSDILRARLSPVRHGIASVLRAVTSLVSGALLATYGAGGWGLIAGALVGTLAPAPLFNSWIWFNQKGARPSLESIRAMLQYGLPLTASLSLGFIIRGSDRLILGWLADSTAVGVYAAGYDLAQNSLEVLMAVVNLAAFTLAVNALSSHGVLAARRQLAANLSLLTAIALPATAGLWMTSSNLSRVVLGVSFREDAALIIPWVAVGVLLSGLRAYYVDHAFQLGNRTSLLIWVLLPAAAVNVVLNIALIPEHGVLGAAYATVVAYAMSFVIGVFAARKAFPIPFPLTNLAKAVGASCVMVAALSPLTDMSGPIALLTQIATGTLSYAIALFALDGLGMRTSLTRRMRGVVRQG